MKVVVNPPPFSCTPESADSGKDGAGKGEKETCFNLGPGKSRLRYVQRLTFVGAAEEEAKPSWPLRREGK